MPRFPLHHPPRRAALAWALAASVFTAFSLPAWGQAQSPSPQGRWITGNGNLEVEVAPCGQALCGTAVKVLGNRSMSAEGAEMKPVDTRPVVGMKILIDFKPDPGADEPTWEGQIYNRENGKTYRCEMRLGPTGDLVLRAYVGLPLFGKTQVWRRP